MDNFVMWVLAGAATLGVAVYLYLDYQAKSLRTRVVEIPGGLRFEAWGFSVEMHRAAQQVKLQSNNGQLTRTPREGGEPEVQNGPLELTLPAAGLQIEVVRKSVKVESQEEPLSMGHCTITVRGPDASQPDHAPGLTHTEVLKIPRVPESVGQSFQQFASRVRVWVEKTENRMERDRKEQLRKEQDAAQAAAQEALLAEARANQAPDTVLTEADVAALADAQVAQWRKAAGFTGTASEISVGPDGRVVWFIDLANDGHVTLHADKRTIHTTLKGASIDPLGGELDIGVRDDYWSEDDPSLKFFRIFKGLPLDKRRAWKEKLELVRNSLNAR
jgi:hypothetical protein